MATKGTRPRRGQPGERCVLVIFGASGDLTKRKLIPALYNLAQGHLLPKEFAVIGISTSNMTNEEYRAKLSADIGEYATGKVDPEIWKWLGGRLYYMPGNFRDPESYGRLRNLLAETDKTHKTGGNHLFYLATPPDFFAEITKQLGAAGMVTEEGGTW